MFGIDGGRLGALAAWGLTILLTAGWLGAETAPPHGGITVEKIHAEVVDGDSERVCMQFSERVLPVIEVLEGQKPRVFLDVEPVDTWKGPERIPLGGKMILRVRTHLNQKAKRLRIVLDLEPSKDFFVDQTYIESGNIFCLETTLQNP